MMLAPSVENVAPFSLEALTQLYQKLDFSSRARSFEIFLRENAQLSKKNPPYSTSKKVIGEGHACDRPLRFITNVTYGDDL